MIDPEYREYSYYIAKWNDTNYTATTYDEAGEEYEFDAPSEAEAVEGVKKIIDRLLKEGK